MIFETKTFTIPTLVDISKTNTDEHLKLYQGYVKHVNLILEKINILSQSQDDNTYTISELRRRFGFEFCGMKNHEYFFEQFENGSREIDNTSQLYKKILETWGSFENWQKEFYALALTRGIGWAMLYRDRDTGQLLNAWVDEQHIGQLTTCDIILALDMWEHAYVYDYPTSEKKKYIDAFFKNMNWGAVELRFKN
jgi:Fe-Mn family superoxide dismutase